jgi:hypothetical protein
MTLWPLLALSKQRQWESGRAQQRQLKKKIRIKTKANEEKEEN